MGFFDFVEQHHAVGLAADLICQLAAVIIADIAGRRADQAGAGVFFAEFAHVDFYQIVRAAEHFARQHSGQLGLADARRSHENKRADRPLVAGHARTAAPNGARHLADRLRLADHVAAQVFLQRPQQLGFLGDDPAHRDAGHHRNRGGNVVSGKFERTFFIFQPQTLEVFVQL